MGGESSMSHISLQTLIEKAVDLPVVPHVASRVMDEVTNPRTTAERIANIISQDQALLGRIMRVSNSTFYRRRIPITTLEGAIVRLGPNLVRDLTISLSTRSLFRSISTVEELLWKHTIAVGIAAQQIAHQTGFGNPQEAFVGGVLHDTGKIVLINHNLDKYLVCLREHRQSNQEIFEIEREHYHFDHADVGGVLLEKWNLSKSLQKAVRNHHSVIDAPSEYEPLTRAVAAGNIVANIAGYTLDHPGMPEVIKIPSKNLELFETLRLGENQIAEIIEDLPDLLDELLEIHTS